MKSLFKLGGSLSPKSSTLAGIGGFLFLIGAWFLITDWTGWVRPETIPSPIDVFTSIGELYNQPKHGLMDSAWYSIGLNVRGFMEAISIAVPLGFLLALIPLMRGMFSKNFQLLRFVPITGLTGVFIAWFGIGTPMKAHFLAFGVLVYLLPVVIQRVYETEKVHLDTVFTLGANSWQTFRKVYLPSVLSKVIVDIRVIVSISWTYIIVAEMVNNSEGGLGSMIFWASKQSRLDKIFAIMLIIILIGIIQDMLFRLIERIFFKFKFAQK